MSIEINGFDRDDSDASQVVTRLAVRLCLETGSTPVDAHSTGKRGAGYAAELLLTTLRTMGALSEGPLDLELLEATATQVVRRSGVQP